MGLNSKKEFIKLAKATYPIIIMDNNYNALLNATSFLFAAATRRRQRLLLLDPREHTAVSLVERFIGERLVGWHTTGP